MDSVPDIDPVQQYLTFYDFMEPVIESIMAAAVMTACEEAAKTLQWIYVDDAVLQKEAYLH
jgi:hypothetical protein